MATASPSAASRLAMARPIPDPPPVTTAVRCDGTSMLLQPRTTDRPVTERRCETDDLRSNVGMNRLPDRSGLDADAALGISGNGLTVPLGRRVHLPGRG